MPLAHVRRGSGPPLVLIHGIGSQWQMWQPVLDRLAREREVVSRRPARASATPTSCRAQPTVEALAGAVGEFLEEHRAGRRARRGQLARRRRRAASWRAQGGARSACVALPRGLREHARGPLRARRARQLAPGRAAPRAARRARARRPGAAHAGVRPPRRAAVAGAARRGRRRDAQPRPLARLRDDAARRSRTIAFGGHDADCPVTVAWGEKDRLLLYSRQSAARARAASRTPATSR